MSSTPVSTTAWVLHDLGLATLFGGTLFGKLALHPAANRIPDERKRGEVINAAWNKFQFAHLASLATVGITWFVGRGLRSGREVGRQGRQTTLAKDVLVGAMLGTGVATAVTGMLLGRARARTQAPMQGGLEPAPETPPKVGALQRAVNILGDVTLLLVAGVQATTAMLAMQGSRSTTWTLSSRRLP